MPAPWPLCAGEADAAVRPLPVRRSGPRGALRVRGAPDEAADPELAGAELVLLGGGEGLPRVRVLAPDFRGPGTLEFYGLPAGPGLAFVRSGDRAGPLVPVTVEAGAIAELEAGELRPAPIRRVLLEERGRPLFERATLFADYGAFSAVMPWEGRPLELAGPLARPSRIAVRLAARPGEPAARFGGSFELAADAAAGDLRLAVGGTGAGDLRLVASIGLAGPGDLPAGRTFRAAAWSGAGRPLASQLACLREAEFRAPPLLHTLAEGLPGPGRLIVEGVPAEPLRVACGFAGAGRSALWRRIDPAGEDELPLALDGPRAELRPDAGAAPVSYTHLTLPTIYSV